MADLSDTFDRWRAKQLSICRQYGVEAFGVEVNQKLGIAKNVLTGKIPIRRRADAARARYLRLVHLGR